MYSVVKNTRAHSGPQFQLLIFVPFFSRSHQMVILCKRTRPHDRKWVAGAVADRTSLTTPCGLNPPAGTPRVFCFRLPLGETNRRGVTDLPRRAAGAAEAEGASALDAAGFAFVRRVVAALEARGLEEQGLYRVAGVASRVARLVASAREPRPPALTDAADWETRTLTSALKSYLRALPDPLLTRQLHRQFIAVAKSERRAERVAGLRALVHALPPTNRDMLRLVLEHLRNVAAKSDKNLMTHSNLAVCFGPTLLRAERETVASILELKFYNVIVETLLEHYHEVSAGPVCVRSDEDLMTHSNLAVCFGPTLLRAERETVASILELKFYNVIVETLLEHYHEIFESPPPAPPAAPALAQPPPPPVYNGIIRTSPTSIPVSARNDIGLSVGVLAGAGAGVPAGAGACERGGARYSPHHHQLLHHFAPTPGVGRSSSSSAESVSSHSASPPPALLARPQQHFGRYTRVRTLYACLGESDGELSFEPNQIVTNVAPSGEPGWLRGTLNGKTGLVPENYVEPLP
ncbi:rho GTPase-activating protein 26-like [Ostrinia nubilalis]|uniref:rho GTPase-activating protein 26-like n=1 Tax=Ostrinia nubilalis TaxID=29057 RepID=UPI00308258E4